MALQVWLPLNGNLNNQGLSNVTVTNSGATVNSAGKIGSCYSFSNTYMSIANADSLGFSNKISLALWFKLSSSHNNWSQVLLFGTSGTAWTNIRCGIDINSSGVVYFNVATASSNKNINSVTAYKDNAWHHAVAVLDETKMSLYIDGVLKSSDTTSITPLLTSTYIYIGGNAGGERLQSGGLINDIRIYDHCLSPKEVKEISKGLVLHYKLDDPYVEPTTNLITGISYVARCTIEGNGVRVAWNVTSGDTYLFFNTSEEMVQGTTYTLSFDVEGLNESGVSFAWSNITGGDNRYLCVLHNGHNVKTFTHNSSESRTFFDDIHRNNTSNFWMGNFQLEKKDHATPYTSSSRSGVPVYDCSGYGRNGTIASTPTIASTTPRYSKCINFTDSATSIAIGIFPEIVPDGNFTFNCWFMKKTGEWSSKGYETIFGGPSGFELEAKNGSTNAPSLVPWNWGKNAITYELDKWNMVTFTRNTSETKLYLNGGETVTTGTAGSIPLGNYFIGAWSSASSQNYRGYLSDARIYSTVLSADDIKELYDTSAIIYNDGTVAAREAIETNNDNVDITKTGIISTQRFIECKDYLYLPAGNGVTTDLYYDNGDTCTAETIIRYESGGSGRDLMGFSGAAAGYWGVSSSGYWEIYGASSSYTDSDITKLNRIFYQYTAQTSVAGDHGYYQIGRLANSYSVRTKYIYNVKLYKNGVLERDLYPASSGTVAGLMDALHGTFYVATGTGSGRSSLGNDEAPTARFYKDHIQANQIIEI